MLIYNVLYEFSNKNFSFSINVSVQIIILIQTKTEVMRETIPQKIERLERTITNLKNEERELKKGKRLLLSEVRTLKKQMERTDRNYQIQMDKEISLRQYK